MKEKKSANWISGRVNWYDPTTGKGSIISDAGIWYRIHEFSQIITRKSKPLTEKARVEFELARDSINPIVKTVRQISEKETSEKKSERQLRLWEETK